MAKTSEMIESKYLKQADVADEEMVVTIVKVGKGNIAKEGDEPELKWMVRFNEFSKPMIINSTNIKRLARACGSEESDDWVGKKVVLYVDHDVEYAGNVVGGLRIRGVAKADPPARSVMPQNQSRQPGNFEQMTDDVPF